MASAQIQPGSIGAADSRGIDLQTLNTFWNGDKHRTTTAAAQTSESSYLAGYGDADLRFESYFGPIYDGKIVGWMPAGLTGQRDDPTFRSRSPSDAIRSCSSSPTSWASTPSSRTYCWMRIGTRPASPLQAHESRAYGPLTLSASTSPKDYASEQEAEHKDQHVRDLVESADLEVLKGG